MGNSVQSHQFPATRCLGCLASNDGNFDNNELTIGLDTNKPKGKITPQSTAYLSAEEINFFKAASGRNISLIRFYLNKGVNINILDEERTSPLHVAARHGSVQVIQELILDGSDLNITDMAGWTPLHIASFFQRSQVCQLLLQADADSSMRNREGQSPLDLVRDKMTAEVFKLYQAQCENEEKNNSVGDISFCYKAEKQQKQKESAKLQYDQYYTNLKKRLSLKQTDSQVNQFSPSLVRNSSVSSPNKAQQSQAKNTPQKQGQMNEMEGDDQLSFLRQQSVQSKFIPQHELVPPDILSEYKNQSPCYNQQSMVLSDPDLIQLSTLIKVQQKENQGAQPINISHFRSGSTKIYEIGVEIFSTNPLFGLSFLGLTEQLKLQPDSIARFLMKEQKYKQSVGDLLSNTSFSDADLVLDTYVGMLNCYKKDFITALREFFDRIVCNSDPFRLDCLVMGLSRHLYRIFHNHPFKSEAAVHMFTFALLVLDIEVNYQKGRQNIKKMQQCVQDFLNNIQIINEGNNFDQTFINYIIDEISRRRILTIKSPQTFSLDQVKITLSKHMTSITLIKVSKNNKLHPYDLFIVDKFVFLITNTQIVLIPKTILTATIYQKKDVILARQNNFLPYAKSREFRYFELKQKEQLKFQVASQSDCLRLQKAFS